MEIFATSRFLLLYCMLGTFFCSLPAQAFNSESAELTFHTDTTNTSPLRYFFKLVLYNERSLTIPDIFPTAQISFGDGNRDAEVLRANRALLNANTNIYREVYYFEHQFPEMGTFIVSFREVNRRIGYLNITNPENIAFSIQATIKVGAGGNVNRSPVFLAPIIPTGLLGQPYRHNVTAYDPDGDSLAFKLVPARQNMNQYISSYQFPGGATINSQTGEFIWLAPDKSGRHAVVLEIWEYRQGQLIGKVMREIAVIILPTGVSPVVEIRNRSQVPMNAQNQVFITADMPVKIRVSATNATGLTAYSELFRHNIITAMPTADSPPEIEYTIRPDPALKRSLPYIITFRGTGAATTTGPPSQDYNTSSSRQQDLTLAIYFRPERTTDQQDATQPGEIPIPDEEPEPQDKSDSLAFNVYPNPVGSYLYIQNNRHVPATLYLYNTQNQLVLTQVLTLQQTIISRSSTVTAGMYFYTIISEGGKIEQTGRLVLL